MRTNIVMSLALLVTAWSVTVHAQQGQAAKPEPPKAAPKQDMPKIEPGYAYDPKGRRDPFISLLGSGDAARPQTIRPAGLAGILIEEVSVKGVLRTPSGFMALLQGPDKKTHTVRVGDKLLDGSVKSIGEDKIVFSQNVNDPLSLVKQREVAKPVRPGEGRG